MRSRNLTPPQFAVLKLSAEGLKPPEIAKSLKIPQSTVQRYQCKIRNKIGLFTDNPNADLQTLTRRALDTKIVHDNGFIEPLPLL